MVKSDRHSRRQEEAEILKRVSDSRSVVDNLWLLGGENIHNISYGHDEDNDTPPAEQLMSTIGPDGGPLCRYYHNETEQKGNAGA